MGLNISKEQEERIMSNVPYNHKAIEKKWRERLEQNPVNLKADEKGNKREKYYCLDMFPYPS